MIVETVDLLGHKAKDKITGFEGVIASVCFDLYGCVQVVLTPRTEEGKLPEAHWFDVSRIEITDIERVMACPDFVARATRPQNYDRGPTDKPAIITTVHR